MAAPAERKRKINTLLKREKKTLEQIKDEVSGFFFIFHSYAFNEAHFAIAMYTHTS